LELTSVAGVVKAIASAVVRHETTRVMMALAQAADEEPTLRSLFRELADGVALRFARLLENLNISVTEEKVALIHAATVGLAVIEMPQNAQTANGAPKRFSIRVCVSDRQSKRRQSLKPWTILDDKIR
jgi:hypothetical protein